MDQLVIGHYYRGESGSIHHMTKFGLRALCRDCEKHGRVPRQPAYKDENGKCNKLCGFCARNVGTYAPTQPCLSCNKREARFAEVEGKKRTLCTECARDKGKAIFDKTNDSALLKELYRSVEARKDKYGGDLMSFEDFYDIYKSQDGVCALSGKQFDLSSRMDQPSPDRIDSTRGYSKDNVFFTSFGVNRARLDLSLDDFVQMCKMVVSYSSHTLDTTNPIPSQTDTGPTGLASDSQLPPKKRMRV